MLFTETPPTVRVVAETVVAEKVAVLVTVKLVNEPELAVTVEQLMFSALSETLVTFPDSVVTDAVIPPLVEDFVAEPISLTVNLEGAVTATAVT